MATRETVELIDDLDGGPADTTVEFSLDNKTYEIDLSETNATKLRDSLALYIAAARLAGRIGKPNKPGRGPKRDREQNEAIRRFARARGMKVGDRGRIPADVLEAYEQSA